MRYARIELVDARRVCVCVFAIKIQFGELLMQTVDMTKYNLF